jgi:hypothetical protein
MKRFLIIVLALMLALSAFALMGCDETTVGEITTADETAEPAGNDEEVGEEVAEGTRDNPLAMGTEVIAGDWTVVINSVNLDATDEVLEENMFNDDPADGSVYVLVNATVTYNGDSDQGESFLGGTIEIVTAGGNSIASYDTFAVAPDPLDTFQTLFEGASVSGNLVFEVAEEDLDGFTISVAPTMFADSMFVASQ